jgi:outer membrane lipoprotein-sorting protein
MKLLLLAAAAAIAGFGLLNQGATNPALKAHIEALKSAKSLAATFTVAKLPAAPVAYTLTYAKPGLFRIESPETLIVCDGKTLTELNKADNTYTEADAATSRTSAEDVWAWAAFFDAEAFKGVTGVTAGAKRSIKGKAVSELSITLSSTKSATLFLDAKTGVARGASLKVNKGGDTVEYLTLASDITLGTEPIDAATFAFVPPAGAKKAEKPKVEAVSFAKVDAIFQAACLNCHGPGNPKAGYDLSNYASVMAGNGHEKFVVPGEPEKSVLLGVVNGTRSPRMPKNAPPLSAADVKTIHDWIASGAKE